MFAGMQISLRMRGVYLRVQGIALFRSSAAANVDLDARRPEGTERVKFVRSKPSDTFGTLRTFEEKLLPLKISERPKNRSTVCEIADENWEGSYEEEEIGWTPNYLRALRKDDSRDIPVITEPVVFGRKRRIKERKKKEAEEAYERLYGVDRKTARVIIECARKEYNHYEGMRYPAGDIQLASQYWIKSKYKNDWFTINPITKKNPSFNRDEVYSWDEIASSINPLIIENVQKLGCRFPTVVQRRAFRAFGSNAHLLVAAETGSGKTFAYACPLLSAAMANMQRHTKDVILVPTHALRIQTFRMISELANGTGIRVIGGTEAQPNEGDRDWHILVSTPNLSSSFLRTVDFEHVVLDEADMLLDDSFMEDITVLLGRIKIRHSAVDKHATDGARLIFSSATCPDELQRATESIVDEEHLYCIRTDNLHCLMPHVKHTFIRIREMDKLEKLKELLQKGLNFASGQTLIFCKDLSNVKLVSTALRENGIEHAVCGGGRQIRHLIEELRDGKIRIIVATDVASRGLDLAHLRHIVNYDFPRQISDYVHRCGRIGRVGSIHKSLVTSFVRRAWEVKHVNTIELAARLGRPLEDVEMNNSARLRGMQKILVQ